MEYVSTSWIAGQLVSLIALALCVIGFASKRDDRLFVLLIFANVAFALQFALFGSWVASGITALIVLRVILVRHYKGNLGVMAALLIATMIVTVFTWHGLRDLAALAAGVLGTYGMFMLEGIPMRLLLAAAALCWVLSNAFVGSIGGTIAESLILLTNAITIGRLARERRAAVY